MALVQENVALHNQSTDDYGTSSSLKQMSNNGFFERTGAINAGKREGKCTVLCVHKYNQKRTQFRMPLRANRVHAQSFCQMP